MNAPQITLIAGWLAVLCGVGSGMAMGLFFHHERWLGGYGAFRRRMLRLGHIACFGLGFLNLFFSLTARAIAVAPPFDTFAAGGLVVGAATMPLVCIFTAWRTVFRHAFALPVASILVGVVALLIGGRFV